MLTAKSQHTPRCLGQLKDAGALRTLPIFCCQNSIWNEPYATRVFDKVYGVVLRVPGIFLEPGLVINPITGNHGFIEVGLYPRGKDELLEYVSEAIRKTGFACKVNEWVMKAKAAKCLGNLGNALGLDITSETASLHDDVKDTPYMRQMTIRIQARCDEAGRFPPDRRAERFLPRSPFWKCPIMVRKSMGHPDGFSTLFRASNLLSQYRGESQANIRGPLVPFRRPHRTI